MPTAATATCAVDAGHDDIDDESLTTKGCVAGPISALTRPVEVGEIG